MRNLTIKQKAVLDYIKWFKDKFQYSPTTREIQDHFGWKSQTAAVGHLNALETKGYIAKPERAQRAITILK